jgi:RNA polymerase sigma factor for flagellar operon FliA
MLDEVRRLSYATRTTVTIKKEQSEAVEHLSNLKGRPPTSSEVASYLGKSLDVYEKERLIAQGSETLSSDSNDYLVQEEIDESSDPSERIELEESLSQLQELIQDLPERTQLVLSLYYVEELNLKEIAAILSVSEGRISQILNESAAKLRLKMETY